MLRKLLNKNMSRGAILPSLLSIALLFPQGVHAEYGTFYYSNIINANLSSGQSSYNPDLAVSQYHQGIGGAQDKVYCTLLCITKKNTPVYVTIRRDSFAAYNQCFVDWSFDKRPQQTDASVCPARVVAFTSKYYKIEVPSVLGSASGTCYVRIYEKNQNANYGYTYSAKHTVWIWNGMDPVPPITITYAPDSNSKERDSVADSQSVCEQFTVRGSIFTRSGYHQTGWKDSNGKSYAFGSEQSVEEALTLYPVWTSGELSTVPSITKISASAYSCVVYWKLAANAVAYNIYRSTTDTCPSTPYKNVAADTTATSTMSWSDGSTVPGVEYHYWVQAVTDSGTSDVSPTFQEKRENSSVAGVFSFFG